MHKFQIADPAAQEEETSIQGISEAALEMSDSQLYLSKGQAFKALKIKWVGGKTFAVLDHSLWTNSWSLEKYIFPNSS